MYLDNGTLNGTHILSRTTIQSIMGNQIGDIWADGQDLAGEGSSGTFDWGGYFNTQYFADPKEQIIGVLMKQTQGIVDDQTGWKFRQMVFAAVDD